MFNLIVGANDPPEDQEQPKPILRSGHLNTESRSTAIQKEADKKELQAASKRLKATYKTLEQWNQGQGEPTPPTDRSTNRSRVDLDQHIGSYSEEEFEMAPEFEDENGTDPTDVQAKLSHVNIEFDPTNVKFCFIQIQSQMELLGIKSQWLKRQLLSSCCQRTFKMDMMDILSQSKTVAGATAYKVLKTRVVDLFGERTKDIYQKASLLEISQNEKGIKSHTV